MMLRVWVPGLAHAPHKRAQAFTEMQHQGSITQQQHQGASEHAANLSRSARDLNWRMERLTAKSSPLSLCLALYTSLCGVRPITASKSKWSSKVKRCGCTTLGVRRMRAAAVARRTCMVQRMCLLPGPCVEQLPAWRTWQQICRKYLTTNSYAEWQALGACALMVKPSGNFWRRTKGIEREFCCTLGSVSSEERLRGLRLYSRAPGDRGSESCDSTSEPVSEGQGFKLCCASRPERPPGPAQP